MKTDVVKTLTRTFHRAGLVLKKHSPEIMVVAGVIGGITSAVMACKATTKLDEVKKQHEENIKKINDAAEKGHIVIEEDGAITSETYTQEDAEKDLKIVTAKHGLKIAGLYAPSVILGTASVVSILAGHRILKKRSLALAAAYLTEHNGFKEYRNNVIERFGTELDKELKYNIKKQEVEEIVVDEDGTEKIEKRVITTANINEPSVYARFFDESCAGWTKDPEYNLIFVKRQQDYANEKLQKRGHLFLNEVYEMLGLPRTTAGQIVGWVYDPENPDVDSHVSFGIHDVTDERKRAFVNGYERSILLDFNVDGEIVELLG